MKSKFKETIAVFLLVCFVVSLTATSAAAKTYKLGDGQNNVDDQKVIHKYQACLNYLGYLDSDSVNGYYGQETVDAVTKFQKDHGITPVSGNIGGKTHNALKKACLKTPDGILVWYGNEATFDTATQKGKQLKDAIPEFKPSLLGGPAPIV